MIFICNIDGIHSFIREQKGLTNIYQIFFFYLIMKIFIRRIDVALKFFFIFFLIKYLLINLPCNFLSYHDEDEMFAMWKVFRSPCTIIFFRYCCTTSPCQCLLKSRYNSNVCSAGNYCVLHLMSSYDAPSMVSSIFSTILLILYTNIEKLNICYRYCTQALNIIEMGDVYLARGPAWTSLLC